jgi:hypothetical protein
VTGEPRKRARSRFHRFDAPLSFADIPHEYSVADGDEIGAAVMALESSLDRGEQFSTVCQPHGEELAVGTDDYAGKRVQWRTRILLYVPRIIA